MEETQKLDRRRVGQFEISSDLVDIGNWPALMAVMQDVFVVRCEHLYPSGRLSYTAISPHFDEGNEGECAPSYGVVVTEHEDKSITVKWERV